MSDSTSFGFGKFVPGFDFLQNLSKGAPGGIPQMPQLANWVAPTLSVEELEKRIEELKAVQFWLDQNSRALTATVQALEVQKMTLATLKGMNVHMADVANAFKASAGSSPVGAAAPNASAGFASAAESVSSMAARAAEMFLPHPASSSAPPPAPAVQAPVPASAPLPAPAPAPAPASAESTRESAGTDASSASTEAEGAAATSIIDPMQWWGALTQQFQQIASSALKDAAQNAAAHSAQNSKSKRTARQSAGEGSAKQAGTRSAAGKKSAGSGTAARKTAVKSGGARTSTAGTTAKKSPARKPPVTKKVASRARPKS